MAFVPAAAAESIFSGGVETHFPPSSPQDFLGFSELLMGRSTTTTTASFSSMDRGEELQPDDDMSDDGCQMLGEKKRRLNMEQVRALEKSFELGNKLEPERKMELARALGLQPRQIAIWFQNRRARWKTKKLERDYDVLKRQLETLKADNDALKSQNKNLQTQLTALKTRESAGFLSGPINYLNKLENEGSWSINGSCNDNGCEVNLNKTMPSLDDTLLYHRHRQQIHQTTENDTVNAAAIAFPVAPVVASHGFMFASSVEESQDLWPWSLHQNLD